MRARTPALAAALAALAWAAAPGADPPPEPGAPSVILVNDQATGGTGTGEDPWTGWEGAIVPGATARFPAGTYALAAPLLVPRGATLAGEGERSVIRVVAAGAFLGNAPDAGAVAIERLHIACGGAASGAAPASCIQITAGGASGYRIEDVTVEDAGRDGILVIGTKGMPTAVVIRGCKIAGAPRHGIELRTVRDARIESSSVRDTNRGDLGAAIYAGSDADTDGVVVADNDVRGSGDNGIRSAGTRVTIERNHVASVATDGIRLAGDRQTCRGNTVEGAGEQGIKVEDGTGVAVEDNTVSGCGQNGLEVRFTRRQPSRVRIVANTSSRNHGSGLFVFGGERVLVERNRFLDNAANAVKVYVDPGRRVRSVTIQRNELRAPDVAEGDVEDGILVGGAGDVGSITVRDNVLDGRSVWRHGIHVARGSAVRLLRNEIRGAREEPTAQPAGTEMR